MLQQGTQLDQPMKMHLEKCERFNDIIAMHTLPDVIEDRVVNVNKDEFIKETVKSNSKIMKSSRDKSVLCYLESFMIQKHKFKNINRHWYKSIKRASIILSLLYIILCF